VKIEIDTSKPDELRKLKREAEVVLATIEAALQAIGKNGVRDSPGQLPLIVPAPAAEAMPPGEPPLVQVVEEPLPDFFSRLPNPFSMRDALNLAPAENISLPSMRRIILRFVGRGLTQVRRGKGPKPSIFRRTP